MWSVALCNVHVNPFQFAAIIGVLLVAEVAAGIAAYLLKDDIDMAVKEQGPKLLAQYNSSEGVKETWDFVQEKLVSHNFLPSLEFI